MESCSGFVPEFARKNTRGKTISIVCLEIAPEYRGMGIVSAPGYFVIQKALYFVILRQLAQVRGYKQRDYITICTTNLGLSNR